MEKNIALFIILAFLGGLILGYLGGLAPRKAPLPQAEIEMKRAFLQELRDKGILMPEPEEIRNVWGTVESVGQNQLVLLVEQRFDDPLGEFLPAAMTVKITERTKIFKLQEKSPEALIKEEQEYMRRLAEYEAREEEMPPELMPPEPFKKAPLELSEIKKGYRVSVTSAENIKGKSEFEAVVIEVTVPEVF
jgi:hypothetical protein